MKPSYEIPRDRLTICLPVGFSLREVEDFVYLYEGEQELAIFPASVPQAGLLDGINECLRDRDDSTAPAYEVVPDPRPGPPLQQAPAHAWQVSDAYAPGWRLDRHIQIFLSSLRRWGDATWRVAGRVRLR